MNHPDPVTRMPAPADHFESFEQQDHAAHFGMWLFLTSETLLFGALLGLYTGYRLTYAEQFHEAAKHNNAILGTINTVILVSSSFFAAWAVHAMRQDKAKTAVRCLLATLIMGGGFLVIKALEYRAHFAEGIYPGAWYVFPELPTYGAKMFFTLYYFMTGLHAAHVIGGLTALAIILRLTSRGRYTAERHTSLELGVLYWHLVDVIWIFLWPLMYLAGGD
jgi:cytochrome c oxidase subunit III